MAEVINVVKEDGDWVLHLKFPEMDCFGSKMDEAFDEFDRLQEEANPFNDVSVNEDIVNQSLRKAGMDETAPSINDMFAEAASMLNGDDEDDLDDDEEVEELPDGVFEVYLPDGQSMTPMLEQLLGWWIGNWPTFKEMIPDFVQQYYAELYKSIPEEERGRNPLFPAPNKETLADYFQIVALHLNDKEEAIAVEANCSWNHDEGLGFVIYGNGQVKVGTAEMAIEL